MALNNKLSISDINNKKPVRSRLTALNFCTPSINRHGHRETKVFAQCLCGNIKMVYGKHIANGTTLSCGCLHLERLEKRGHSILDINIKMPQNSMLKAIGIATHHVTIGGRIMRKLICVCLCGNTTIVKVQELLSGGIKSCGCLNSKENRRKRATKFSQFIPYINNKYLSMIRRCYNPEDKGYKSYGAKGVRVCEGWLNNYESFLHWCLANGCKPGLHLDKDKIGTGKLYSPETCCFITRAENRSLVKHAVKHKFMFKGSMKTIGEIATDINIKYGILYQRLFIYNMPFDKAISYTRWPKK